jgi:hypothetical protein
VKALLTTLLTGAAFCGAGADAQTLSPDDPEDAVAISRRIMCSETDGEPAVFAWSGDVYSRRMGERDRKLFAVEGMNIRACSAVRDEARGDGFKLVSREILLYLDPETGEVIDEWENPWTGETVSVLHVNNDPVNFEMYEAGRDGEPMTWSGEVQGDLWHQRTTVPLFYPNPLGGDYQREVGGTYHATEMFNFFGDTASLTRRRGEPDVHVGWARVSDWLPWMMMEGREGTLYFHTAGRKLDRFEDLPAVMRAAVAERYPDYAEAPPLDDERPNVTSWSWYKTYKEGQAGE